MEDVFREGLVWCAENQSEKNSRRENLAAALQGDMLQKRRVSEAGKLLAPFGIEAIDSSLPSGGIPFGFIHEFFLTSYSSAAYSPAGPLSILSLLTGNALKKAFCFKKFIVWIGRNCWPTPFLLDKAISLEIKNDTFEKESTASFKKKVGFLDNCIFIDPPSKKLTFWCIETTLRSPAAAIVIADASHMTFAMSRKFSLLAKQSGSLGLFMRPPGERLSPSLACTRWGISPEPSTSHNPRWRLTLTKCRGGSTEGKTWIVEQRDENEKISLHIPSGMVDQPGKEEMAAAKKLSHG